MFLVPVTIAFARTPRERQNENREMIFNWNATNVFIVLTKLSLGYLYFCIDNYIFEMLRVKDRERLNEWIKEKNNGIEKNMNKR